MSSAMIYLNPNISKENADKIFMEHQDRKKLIVDDFLAHAKEKCKTPEQVNAAASALSCIMIAMA